MDQFIRILTEDPDCFANKYWRIDNPAVLFIGDEDAGGIMWTYTKASGKSDISTHAQFIRKVVKEKFRPNMIGHLDISRLSIPDKAGAILLPGGAPESTEGLEEDAEDMQTFSFTDGDIVLSVQATTAIEAAALVLDVPLTCIAKVPGKEDTYSIRGQLETSIVLVPTPESSPAIVAYWYNSGQSLKPHVDRLLTILAQENSELDWSKVELDVNAVDDATSTKFTVTPYGFTPSSADS